MTCTKQLTEQAAAYRALNQLIAVTAGGRFARQTQEFAADPLKRLTECIKLSAQETMDAASSSDVVRLKQCARKNDTLSSLHVLAEVLTQEVEW